MRSTENAFRKRIEIASLEQLRTLEGQIERHYEIGTLTAKEFARLDVLIMEKIAIKESQE